MLTDTLADIMLAFSNLPVVLLITLSGFFLINSTVFFQGACLAAFDIVVNVALKGTFKISLSQASSFAFPSGHMQLSVVFYVWLALCLFAWRGRSLIACLLCGIGASLIHYGYHDLPDVLGGLVAGLILVKLFQYLLQICPTIWHWILLGLASVLMVYNAIEYPIIPFHTWVAYSALWGFVIIKNFIKLPPVGYGGWSRAI
jgi:hypothetical protein